VSLLGKRVERVKARREEIKRDSARCDAISRYITIRYMPDGPEYGSGRERKAEVSPSSRSMNDEWAVLV
jgi:hypothetical protein